MTPGDLHQKVIERLREQFPAYATVDDYREPGEDRTQLAVPALLIQMTDLERAPDTDPQTGQKAFAGIWEATIIMGFRHAAVDRAIRDAVGALAVFVDGQRWGLPDVAPAVVTLGGVDDFSAATAAFKSWRLEWRQVMFLGDDAWEAGGTVPRALASWVPKIGIPHVGTYVPIDEAAP